MDPQRIGALRSLDPQQSLKTFISGYKAPTARTGIPASNKQLPQFSLAQERNIEIGRPWLIGQLEYPETW
ncbi:hypothetical protein BJV77DRAFT_1069148 [Russula vinacea]|nr:hypothetical protein BJV77DRAFT_1069148 [Russula vinacea]